MKVALIATLVGILVLAGIGIAYRRSQAEAAARQKAERRLSPSYTQAARYALDLIEIYDALFSNITRRWLWPMRRK